MKLAILLLAALAFLHPQELLQTTDPMVIHTAEPRYTKKALDAKIEGSVILALVIEKDGTPSNIKVVRGLGMGLDEKAVECLRQWRFKAATDHSQPVSAKATVEVNFRLLSAPKSK
jgi:periplasmic protein TonB